MNITFIGCGDAFSEQDKLGNNSALLEFNGTNLLIDIPDSNYSRMKHIGKTYSDIENLFITHLHGDHINGFERFTYYRQFATPLFKKDAKKVNLYIKDDLYFGFWDSFKNGLGYTAQGIKKLEDYYEVHLIEGNEFTINDVTFNVTSSTHVPNMNVYGLLVEDLFYYSTDSIYEKEWIKYILNDVSYVFHDMHMFEQDIAVHASIRDFAHFSKEKKKKLYAMHYDDSHINIKEKLGIQLVQPYQTIEMKKRNE